MMSMGAKVTRGGLVMVNFMHQLEGTMGYPDIGQTLFQVCFWRCFWIWLTFRSVDSSRADWPSQCGWASCNQLKGWREQKADLLPKKEFSCLMAFEQAHWLFQPDALWTQTGTSALQILNLSVSIIKWANSSHEISSDTDIESDI